VTAPKGSLYNPRFPAAAEARFAQCNRVIDLIYKALAPVLPDEVIAGSSASLSFCAYSGVRPNGDYWVFLEVNEGAYGGRPRSDGPDSIDNLMANTRNNPLEDLAMHLPMICDRYELRDDVMPGAGRFRGGIGVVKAQRMLTDGFITHENERHHDAPWGIFGGAPGQVGKVEIYHIDRPNEITPMPAKFSGVRMLAGDVHVFYAPCGGGFGDPLERPAAQLLEDVLDGFCTVEHARMAYGVVIDPVAETVDAAATQQLRDQLRLQRQTPQLPSPSDRHASPPPPASAPARPSRSSSAANVTPTIGDVVQQLRAAYGDAWSFEIVEHRAHGGVIEVVGQLRADGSTARETAVADNRGCSQGELLERASDESLRKCALALLGSTGDGRARVGVNGRRA
jgi:hypothetical protein